MGRDARRNPTAQAAQRGELMSRATILGAMDHALEVHASSLRFAHEKIAALSERIELLELQKEPAVVRESVMDQGSSIS